MCSLLKTQAGLLALAASLALTTPTQAADLGGGGSFRDTGPTSIWTGLYIGAHGGWAAGAWDGELQYLGGEAGYEDDVRELGGDGWLGGLQVGFNKHLGAVVFGIEVDVSYTGVGGIETYATDDLPGKAGEGGFAKEHDLALEYFGTARARIGYSVGRFLPYITGGLAWAKTEGELTVSYPLAPACCGPVGEVSTASAEEAHLGWTVGGGIEADLGGGWSIKAEYLHIDLGTEDYNFRGSVYNGAPFNTDSFEADLIFDVVRAGLNYRF